MVHRMEATCIKVSVSQIDPDDGKQKDVTHPAVLRFSSTRMTMVVQVDTGKSEYHAERRFLRFRGPRLVQRLLTPLFALGGCCFHEWTCGGTTRIRRGQSWKLGHAFPRIFGSPFGLENQEDAEEASRRLNELFR